VGKHGPGRHVSIAGLKAHRGEKSVGPPILVALAFMTLLGWWVADSRLPGLVMLVYCGVSLAAIVVYWADKSAAEADNTRTPENWLHAISLAGGWPGALIARHALRHKTVKQPFRTVFWITVMLNSLALAWLFTPQGQGFIWSLHYQLN
jgi:uncharacterized membrane protein YsdA (DUF1294 family)